MKYRALTAVLLASAYSHVALAQSDFNMSWTIIGKIGDNRYDELVLDIDKGTQFFAVNGVLNSRELNAATPSNGSCYIGAGNNIFCNLSVNSDTYHLVIRRNLSGTISIVDPSTGNNVQTKNLEFKP